MYHTTGFTRTQIADLVVLICQMVSDTGMERTWPPSLGLLRSLHVTLTYLRRNRIQAEIAETLDTSQSTVSRAITSVTPLIETALRAWVPVVTDLDPRQSYLVDGSLLPCWSWSDRPKLYSGKHKTTGVNVQVACDLDGSPVWISDPMSGSCHDIAALAESGFLDVVDASIVMADRGYQGSGVITPVKKPINGQLTDTDKAFNTEVNRIRYMIERVIANFKTWRIIHTDYRRPFDTFAETISAVIGLHFWRAA